MKLLKCFQEKTSFLFFVFINFDNEEQYVRLLDILFDLELKIRIVEHEELEKTNPFINQKYDIFVFEKDTVLDSKEVTNFILEKLPNNHGFLL